MALGIILAIMAGLALEGMGLRVIVTSPAGRHVDVPTLLGLAEDVTHDDSALVSS